MTRSIAADVLLGLAVAVALVSAVGVLAMRDAYQKLHYVTPLSLVAPVLVALAVLVSSGFTDRSAQAGVTMLLVAIASPFLSHVTIRAARIRADGDWRGQPGQDLAREVKP